MQNTVWMPAEDAPNSRIVGRFVDMEHEWTDAQGIKRKRMVTILEHKVPGSIDISSSIVKDFNREELRRRFSKAWDIYEANKAKEAESPPVPTAVEVGLKGTPIEELDFIGKDRLAFMKSMGFLLAEQVADMSDSICQNISGGKSLRKKAAEYLANKAATAAA